jgi:hypothetical protein
LRDFDDRSGVRPVVETDAVTVYRVDERALTEPE